MPTQPVEMTIYKIAADIVDVWSPARGVRLGRITVSARAGGVTSSWHLKAGDPQPTIGSTVVVDLPHGITDVADITDEAVVA